MRRETLQPDGNPCPAGNWAHLLSEAGHDIPPAGDAATVHEVSFGVIHVSFLWCPFGAEPESIQVTADPSLGVPTQTARSVADLPFQLIEEDEVVDRIVARRVAVYVGKSRAAILVSHGWNGRRQLGRGGRGGSRLSRWRGGGGDT